ncbi:ABC-type transporter, periplasmic subunit [Rhizobium sp. CF080]|uniref:ABC transporter substrate-binding protein n=1 Tax=Rhizobium sp. (strain CF080) TaxID=1144310 RepID=UPI00027188BA|nr:ABC transporter substrate-binding protein [Rhizobium sp. CF080]EUB99294.1 ABC-type transporter, periplasmic subunit [Rhizobium sp. CF080]
MHTRREFLMSTAAAGALLAMPQATNAAGDRSLNVAIGDEPTTIDQSIAWTGVDYTTAENYAEYLIQRSPAGELVPGLAERWTLSSDGKTLDLFLRRGVKFHSGDDFTAQDVIFSFERGRAKSSTVKSRLSSVAKIGAVDTHQVRVEFSKPDVTFVPNRCAAMISSKSYFERVGEAEFGKKPSGTGPFRFTEYKPGEYLDVERFDGYWGGPVQVEKARFSFVAEETTRVAKMQAGEADLITSCPYFAVKGFEGNSSYNVVKLSLYHPTMSIVFGTQNPKVPWADKRVRRAMAHAIDCDAIIKGVLFGIPDRLAFLAPYEVGYDADLKPFAYDPATAKKLLAEAGYADGFPMKLSYAVTGRVQMNNQVAEAIASYFEAVGIKTQLAGEEWGAYRNAYNAGKEPGAQYVGLFTHGRAGAVDPTYNFSLFFQTGGPISIYSNPKLDELNARAKATADNAERAELVKQLVRMVQDEVPSFPVYNNVAVYITSKRIKFTPTKNFNFDLVQLKDVTFV